MVLHKDRQTFGGREPDFENKIFLRAAVITLVLNFHNKPEISSVSFEFSMKCTSFHIRTHQPITTVV